MSDNIFADLVGSFKSGWKAAGSRETFSSQIVRSRPSFWNPLHTWRAEETRQLFALYEEVKQAFEASPFMDADLSEKAVTQIIVQVYQALEFTPSRNVVLAVTDAVMELLNEEFFSFYAVEPDWIRHLDAADASQFKQMLERKRKFLSNADHLFEIGCRKVVIIFASLLELLPESFHQRDDRKDDSGSMNFGVELVDILDGPALAVERTLSTFFDKDLHDGGLFVDVRNQLEHNLYVASGLDPGNKTASEKQMIMPTKTKGKYLGELSELYLKETPFADFFSSSLPLKIPDQARFEHCHILGGTGHGKTQCMQYLLHEDLFRAVEEQIARAISFKKFIPTPCLILTTCRHWLNVLS